MARILAVIDPELDTQTALMRCAELPQDPELSIHIVSFVPLINPDKADNHRPVNVCRDNEQLKKMVKEYRLEQYNTITEIVPFERLYESIILTALNCSADFIFKPLRKHSLIRRSLFTSTDWNLIRLCPLPLLLVSQEKSISKRPVIAALDVCTNDESHAELNRMVLSQANVVAGVIGADVHAVNAYSFPTSVWGYSSSDPISYQMVRAKHEDHYREISTLAEEFGLSADHLVVREGAPALAVNQYAEEIEAGVVVLGTLARSGLAGLFIGNTAESVLESSISDVMVVKQADFQSPVTLS